MVISEYMRLGVKYLGLRDSDLGLKVKHES